MKLQELEKWGIPSRIIKVWSQRQGDKLLPVQSRAVRKGILTYTGTEPEQQPVRMLISAPTGSGKSFCAEMAMVRTLTLRRKVVMLLPLKSLAEQKYRCFQETYASLGVKCLIATGDHPENDERFARNEYDVVVAIYEKFDLLLTANLDALGNIGLVIVDEIQTVSEPGRGAILERLLTKLLASTYQPSLICLSAVIGDGERASGQLVDWLGATLVEETVRPVDLLRGVAAEGSYRYRSFNDELEGDEPFATPLPGEESFEAFVHQVGKKQESTLVFLKSRRETVDYAFRLATLTNWSPAESALKALEGEEPSFLLRTLRQTLSRGVAFHNADLSSYQRMVVEKAFVNREVRVLFSTTTLAMGVDLPADTVFLETVKYVNGVYDNKPILVPVSRAEFDNMTGRAGRPGFTENRPGRAIIMAASEFDRDILWKNYIAPEQQEPVTSAFTGMPLEDWLLNMVVSGLVAGVPDISRVLSRTLWAAVNSEAKDQYYYDVKSVLQRLVEMELVAIDERGVITASAKGRATALTGLSVRQAEYFLSVLDKNMPQTSAAWTALALSVPDWSLPPGILTRYEAVRYSPLAMLYQKYDHLIEDALFLIGANHRREPLRFDIAARLKGLLVLYEWSRMTPVQQLEERFQVHLGQIMALGEQAAHLVLGLSRLAMTKQPGATVLKNLEDTAFELRYGLPVALRELYRIFGDILVRSDYAALYEAGLGNVGDILSSSPEQLAQVVSGEEKLKRCNEKLTAYKNEEVDMQPGIRTDGQPAQVRRVAATVPESIEIDGSLERERYLVKINGFPVRLTGKSFKYFTKLAWSRVHRESGWIYKEDLEVGFNQARYLYRMKHEVAAAGFGNGWSVFENNRLGYYRLKADPSHIRINVENLKNHPDFEVRSLVNSAETGPMN